jgi:siroheme synthase
MGLHNLPKIAEELIAGGLAPTTPVAVIQQGTGGGPAVSQGCVVGGGCCDARAEVQVSFDRGGGRRD